MVAGHCGMSAREAPALFELLISILPSSLIPKPCPSLCCFLYSKWPNLGRGLGMRLGALTVRVNKRSGLDGVWRRQITTDTGHQQRASAKGISRFTHACLNNSIFIYYSSLAKWILLGDEWWGHMNHSVYMYLAKALHTYFVLKCYFLIDDHSISPIHQFHTVNSWPVLMPQQNLLIPLRKSGQLTT